MFAGRWVLLLERDRWAEGRYLAVDVQTVCERNDATRGGEIDRMLCCLCAQSVAPGADGQVWWKRVLEESVKHTVGVSKDLRDGVRLSIELIANEVVDRRRARDLPPLPADRAQPLAVQSLRFLYRILFLLYAEASPHLGVLPVGAPEYDQGYSLDRLRELVQVTLATDQARNGTHLYESLGALFRLVDRGHTPTADDDVDDEGRADETEDDAAFGPGLTFHGLRADLFRPEATAHIDAVGLGNEILQKVLQHLLLSKEKRGRDRGFISYAELGINQLGAVYEGLMSYTGFFATEDLYEVAKDGNAEKGSWVVPVRRSDGIEPKDFVTAEDELTHERKPVLHCKGRFVFRLAGRERQQSASYYTPEVLTRFTVGQALAELLDQDGTRTRAADILGMTVCEPALGSGAFAIEAIRQLADPRAPRRRPGSMPARRPAVPAGVWPSRPSALRPTGPRCDREDSHQCLESAQNSANSRTACWLRRPREPSRRCDPLTADDYGSAALHGWLRIDPTLPAFAMVHRSRPHADCDRHGWRTSTRSPISRKSAMFSVSSGTFSTTAVAAIARSS